MEPIIDESPAAPMCSTVGDFLELFARSWTLQVVFILATRGALRFGVLRRSIPGISARVLAERLRALEARGLVRRDHEPTIPPKVTYHPTARMMELGPTMQQFGELSHKWSAADAEQGGGTPQ